MGMWCRLTFAARIAAGLHVVDGTGIAPYRRSAVGGIEAAARFLELVGVGMPSYRS